MSVKARLARIEKGIAALPPDLIALATHPEYDRILDPTEDDIWAAMNSITDTMPKEYVELLEADLKWVHDLNLSMWEWDDLDHYSKDPKQRSGKPHPKPLTQRFVELVDLRIHLCPRPLALPEGFCRALAELDPDKWLSFSHHCEICFFEHPIIHWWEDLKPDRPRWQGPTSDHRNLFDRCLLCGGTVKWIAANILYFQPCHRSEGSPYQLAWARRKRARKGR